MTTGFDYPTALEDEAYLREKSVGTTFIRQASIEEAPEITPSRGNRNSVMTGYCLVTKTPNGVDRTIFFRPGRQFHTNASPEELSKLGKDLTEDESLRVYNKLWRAERTGEL